MWFGAYPFPQQFVQPTGEKSMRKPTKFAIRGAMGFGSTGVILPVLAMLLAAYEGPVSPYSYCLPEDPLPVWLELPILASIVCVAGMLGAAFALFGTLNW
jgi:hypothetical protein